MRSQLKNMLRIDYCAVPVTRISTTGGIGYNGKANVGNHRHTPPGFGAQS